MSPGGLTRREFDRILLAAAVAGGCATRPVRPEDRLALSTWSFHNHFPNTRYGPPLFEPDEWTVQEFVRRVHERTGLRAFEVSTAHLASSEASYLDELGRFMKEQGCAFIHLSDNFPGQGVDLASAEGKQVQEHLALFRTWIDAAGRLGIPSMRVNTGGPEAGEWDVPSVVDRFRQLALYGKERGVGIVIENHFWISADPRNVVRIVEAVGENISACPDFGLFPAEDRWTGLALMLPHTRRVVSAKFHGFDAEGTPVDFDFARCVGAVKESGTPAWLSLEYEGREEPFPHVDRALGLATRLLGS
jgi:sugar phosphate isomerase/epimerase